MADPSSEEEQEWLTEIGLRIRMARFRLRINQDELARRSTVSRVTLGRIERGEHAAIAFTYRRLARALGLSLGALMNEVAE